MKNEQQVYQTHPSYGMAGFYRVKGKTNLVGSNIENHEFIRLAIHHAEKKQDLSREWWYASKPIVEVFLSPVQFAQMLTSMNVGDGVPCTLHMVNGQRMPEPPKPEQLSEFKQDIHDTCLDSIKHMKELKEAISKLNVSAKSKNELQSLVDRSIQELDSNIPFVKEQFDKAMDNTVTEAKAAVDAFVTGAAMRLGLEELKSITISNEPKQLDK